MAEARHGYLTTAEGIHIPYQWSYANAAARTGAAGFAATDVGKLARQTDNNSVWMLTAVTPTWLSVGSNLLGDLGEILFTTDDFLLLDFQRWLKNPGDANSQLIGSRLEQIIHTGALRYVPGRFPDKQALAIEPVGKSEVLNPIFEINITDGWSVGAGATLNHVQTQQRFGSSSCEVITDNNANQEGVGSDSFVVAINQTHTASAWIKGTAGSTLTIILTERTAGNAWIANHGQNFTATGQWQRVIVSGTFGGTGAKAQVGVFTNGQQSTTWYLDGAQIEQNQAYATSSIYGDAGPGYAYTGAPHNSTSTRTKTEVNLDGQVDLISGNDTLAIVTWIQMPHDADGTWPVNPAFIFDGYDVGGRLSLRYNSTTDRFEFYGSDGVDSFTLLSAIQTTLWDAGDWVHLVVTAGFNAGGAGSYTLTVNSIQTTDTTANVAAPTLTQWNIGSKYDATDQVGFIYAEQGTLDRGLTAAEIAAMYALQRPLMDEGALENRPTVPGVSAGYWPMLSVACTHTGDANYAEAETAAGTMESRITFADAWVDGQIQFEAILKNSDAGAVDDASAKLQYYHTDSAAWVDVTDSIIAITANTNTPNRVRSAALALPLQEYEYRVVIATPDDAAETVTIYKAGLAVSSGGSTSL